jgi:hypothetical protein
VRGRALLVLLIVLATAGFAIGIAVEKSTAEEPHADETAVSEEGGHEEGEAAEEGGAEAASSETVLGLNLESTPLVIAAVVGSLVLAGAVWVRPRWRPLLVVVALTMLAFAVLDVAEVLHQLDESRAGVAVIAVIVAALHLAAAGTAGAMLRTSE